MALKTFLFKYDENQGKRREDIQNAVRKFLENDQVNINYDSNGKPTVENAGKKLHLSVTCAKDITMAVLYEKPIGIDGEYLPRILSKDNKVDYQQIAEKFFSIEESEFLRDSAKDQELENFAKIWVRKEAYIKAAGKTLADFPFFSVVDNTHFLSKVSGVSIKKFSIKFPDSENYIFAIAGVD